MPRGRIAADQFSMTQLEGLLARRRSQIAKIQRRRGALEKRLAVLDAKLLALGGADHGRGRKGGRVQNEKSLPQTLVHILSSHPKPLKVAEIVKAALASGYRTTSDNFRSIVNQALIKDKRFVAAHRGHYQLKK